jgi:hypothetical protein
MKPPRSSSQQMDDDGGMFSFDVDINDMERDAFQEEGGRQQEKLVDSDFFNKFADDFDEDDMALK